MAAEQCRTCRFSKTYASRMACRRYPPTVSAGRDSDAEFPWVHPGDWCGEWMAMRPGAGLPVAIAPNTGPRPGRVVAVGSAGTGRAVR